MKSGKLNRETDKTKKKMREERNEHKSACTHSCPLECVHCSPIIFLPNGKRADPKGESKSTRDRNRIASHAQRSFIQPAQIDSSPFFFFHFERSICANPEKGIFRYNLELFLPLVHVGCHISYLFFFLRLLNCFTISFHVQNSLSSPLRGFLAKGL